MSETLREFQDDTEIRRRVKTVVMSLEVCALCGRVTECVPSPLINQVGIYYCKEHVPEEHVAVLAPISPDDPDGDIL